MRAPVGAHGGEPGNRSAEHATAELRIEGLHPKEARRKPKPVQPDPERPPLMTIGELSRRTGTRIKALRTYEGMGLVYTAGRSRSNYRLFDESALWCVAAVESLRSLGLTLGEIRELASVYLGRPEEPIGPLVGRSLELVKARIDARGDAGCEAMAVPNGLLGRHDSMGCLVNLPVDRLERASGGRC
jgi:DNA-binding transcriptional MerR regulator